MSETSTTHLQSAPICICPPNTDNARGKPIYAAACPVHGNTSGGHVYLTPGARAALIAAAHPKNVLTILNTVNADLLAREAEVARLRAALERIEQIRASGNGFGAKLILIREIIDQALSPPTPDKDTL